MWVKFFQSIKKEFWIFVEKMLMRQRGKFFVLWSSLMKIFAEVLKAKT